MKFVIGIDEVGRGPLAGPVSVCILAMTVENYEFFKKLKQRKNLRDSKKLSEKQRNEWFREIIIWQEQGFLNFDYETKSAADIDKFGISVVIKKCIEKGLEKLKIKTDDQILLDGSLYAPEKFKNQKTIIRGDEKESIISLASIVAKVMRDKFMVNLAKKYPEYSFEVNKGYGTAAHCQAIKKHGLSSVHRKSFCKNFAKTSHT